MDSLWESIPSWNLFSEWGEGKSIPTLKIYIYGTWSTLFHTWLQFKESILPPITRPKIPALIFLVQKSTSDMSSILRWLSKFYWKCPSLLVWGRGAGLLILNIFQVSTYWTLQRFCDSKDALWFIIVIAFGQNGRETEIWMERGNDVLIGGKTDLGRKCVRGLGWRWICGMRTQGNGDRERGWRSYKPKLAACCRLIWLPALSPPNKTPSLKSVGLFSRRPNIFGWTGRRVLAGPGSSGDM